MDHITYMPIEQLTTPHNGAEVLTNRWVVVHPEHGALFYRRWTIQCNSDERITKHLIDKMYPGCEARFFEVVYVPRDPRDFQ